MNEWNGWIYKLCYEVLHQVEPYMVSLITHFVIFCITMLVVILMLVLSRGVISFCERKLNEDPLAVKVLVYASDLLIIGHFVLYLGHGLSL
jgi:hypothetical protein